MALSSALRPGCCTRVPATIMRWDRRPKRCEALGKPKTLRRSLPGAGRAGCAWTEQSGLAEGEKWRLKRPLRAAVQDAKRTHAGGVYFSLAPTLGYYELNVALSLPNPAANLSHTTSARPLASASPLASCVACAPTAQHNHLTSDAPHSAASGTQGRRGMACGRLRQE